MTEQIAEAAPAEQSPIVEATPEPPAPEPQETSPEPAKSAREALESAFKKVDGGEGDDAGEAAKTETKSGEQPRGPDGKFAAKETDGGKTPAKGEVKAEDEKADAPKAEPDKPATDTAPARFSADAKAEWEKAPASVRGEIKRAMQEMEAGIEGYRQTVEPLKPFLELAKRSNVDPAQVVNNYVQTEQLLYRDPKAGLEVLARNMGTTLPELIAKVSGGEADAKDTEIASLRNELAALRGEIGNVSQNFQRQQTQTVEQQVQAFAAENPRFDELAPDIQRLLETGYTSDLKSAYEIADRLKPAPQVPNPEPTPAPAQPRAPKSVTGAPSAGSTPANRSPATTPNEALQRAFDRVGL